MKRLLVLFLLLFSITTFAATDLKYLLEDQRFNLTYGVTLPDTPALTDFSVRFTPSVSPTKVAASVEALIPFQGMVDRWYQFDFSEEPFDGVIQLAAVGQPSPSATVTLIIALLCSLFLVRKYHAHLAQPGRARIL